MRTRLVLLVALAVLRPAHAQTSYPMITHTTPPAVQRGQSVTLTVEGQQDFRDTYKALFDGPGFTATFPDAAKKATAAVRKVTVQLAVTPEATPGVHDFRLAASHGLSSIGQLLVVDEPVVMEKGVNNTPAQALKVTLPACLCGKIEAVEDVDYFSFEAGAGQVLTFALFGARMQDRIHDMQKHADPIVTLYDADGREVAANDDSYFADPLLTYTVPKAGTYFVQVRDSKYDGDPRWTYALVATPRPYASHLFPLATNPGQTLQVQPVGSAGKAQPRVAVTAPTEQGIQEVSLDVGGQKTNPVAMVVSPLRQVVEQEPNDTPEQATVIPFPAGVNGRIGKPRDLDHFRLKATKGQAVRLEVFARRFGTPLISGLDSMLEVLNARGAVLAGNDDTTGKDSALVFTPPADGEYVIRLRDLNSKGGEEFVYYLAVEPATPDFALRVDPDKAMLGPGSSTTWFVHVTRSDGFDGPVKVEVEGLPKGVTVNPLTIQPTMTQGILVLTVATDAARDATNVVVTGTGARKGADGKEETLRRRATPNQEIYLPGGGRGRFDVNMQSVAVTEPSDLLRIEVTPAEVVLKPGQEVKLEVNVVRSPNYTKAISLDVLLRHLNQVHGNPLPPGVTLVEGKSKTLLGTASKGHIVLKAAADAAPIEGVPISVMAHVSINFVVKVSYSSPAVKLSIRK